MPSSGLPDEINAEFNLHVCASPRPATGLMIKCNFVGGRILLDRLFTCLLARCARWLDDKMTKLDDVQE